MALEFEDFVNGLTEETSPDNAADFLVIVDTSGSDVNKVKPSALLGTDLTAIKALTPTNDDLLQRKSGAWTNRTVAQVKTDLGIVENATHTGEVTGSGALTIDKTAITGKTGVSAAVGDSVLISDASDTDNLKKATIQSIVDLVPAAGASIGGTVTGATAGSVFFAGALGVLAQNNAAFQWVDADTQLQLTAGSATKTPLEINLFAAQSADAFQVKNSASQIVNNITADGGVGLFVAGVRILGLIPGDGTNYQGLEFGASGSGNILQWVSGTPRMVVGFNARMQWDGGNGAGTTGIMVWDVDNNALERVSVGAADSGGTGYKVLRIPN